VAEARISTPLVLAAASGMLAIGVVVYLSVSGRVPAQTDEPEPEPGQLHLDDSSPEAAAESFYDAWRRRHWGAAHQLSVDDARREVLQKEAADAELPRDERIIAERGWDALAQAPLTLNVDRIDIEEDERYVLYATAEYDFVGHPYRRRVVMHVHQTDDGYRVSRMDLGEVLTEIPPMFRGEEP